MLKKWSLENVSKQRGLLFGIATIAIIIVHSSELNFLPIFNSEAVCEVLDFFRSSSVIGVDMFLLMSGLGLYYSYSGKKSLKDFYKKRLIRVIPTLIFASAIAYGFSWKISAFGYVKNFLMLGAIRDEGKWFFTLLLIMYALYPVFFNIIKKLDWKGLLLILAIVFGINFTLMETQVLNFYACYEIILTRIPVFILGIMLGKMAFEKREIKSYWAYIVLLIGIADIIALYFLNFDWCYVRYLRSLWAICLVIVVAYFASKLKKQEGPCRRFLSWIGAYSLELYILTQPLYDALNPFLTVSDETRIIHYFVIVTISLMISFVIKKIVKELSEKMHW